MHNAMPFAVHFDIVALNIPVGKIVPLVQQKMYDLDIRLLVMQQQKTYDHEVVPLAQQKMCNHDNICSVSS